MSDWSAVIGVNVAIWCVSTIILVPIELYYAREFHRNRESLVIAKRKPGILLLSIGTSILFYFLFQTMLLIIACIKKPTFGKESIISYLTILPLWYTSWFTFICRLWLLYFTINHSVAIINNQWQEIISECHKCCEFYLNQKATWGSWNGLKKKMIIYAVITYGFDILFAILFLQFEADVTAIWIVTLTVGVFKALLSTLIPMGFLIYMAVRIGKCNHHDNFGLGRELRFCTYGYLLILLIRCVDYSISYFGAEEEEEQIVLWSIVVSIEFFCWKCIGFFMNVLQTRWPLKAFQQIMHRYSSRKLGKLAHAKTLKNVENVNAAERNEQLRMRQLLENEKAFDLFMAHCANEHCIECVTSLIEMIQFKQKMFKVIEAAERSQEVVNQVCVNEDEFRLPENCRKSDIVFCGEKDLKTIATELFDKYIRVGCDWEINLSYKTRKEYNLLLLHKDNWKNNKEYDDIVPLYGLYDKCIVEMTTLVRAAFSRFKQSDSFKVLQQKSKSLKKLSSTWKDEEDLLNDDEIKQIQNEQAKLENVESKSPMSASYESA